MSRLLAACVALVLLLPAAAEEVDPSRLHGSWVVDLEAMAEQVRKRLGDNPDPAAERMSIAMLSGTLGDALFEFRPDGSLLVRMAGSQETSSYRVDAVEGQRLTVVFGKDGEDTHTSSILVLTDRLVLSSLEGGKDPVTLKRKPADEPE